MSKFNQVKQKYLSLGVTEDNIDFAISAVKDGTTREIILETLTADYRGMSMNEATALLESLFEANGGEFKKENRGGFVFGSLLLILGVAGIGVFISLLIAENYKIKFLLISGAAALLGLTKGSALLYKSFRGKYRDADSPFENQ